MAMLRQAIFTCCAFTEAVPRVRAAVRSHDSNALQATVATMLSAAHFSRTRLSQVVSERGSLTGASVNAASTGDRPWWWCVVATFGNATLIGVPKYATYFTFSVPQHFLSPCLSFFLRPSRHHWIAQILMATSGSLDLQTSVVCCCTGAAAPFGRVLKNVIPVNNEPIKIKYHW